MSVDDRCHCRNVMDAYATWTKIESVVTPFDELLGSSAEEGRAKLRKTPRRRKEPLMRRSPNGNPIASAILTYVRRNLLD